MELAGDELEVSDGLEEGKLDAALDAEEVGLVFILD